MLSKVSIGWILFLISFILSFTLTLEVDAQTEDTTHFNIDLRYLVPVEPSIEAVFESAKTRWESVIINDLGNVVRIPQGQELCGQIMQSEEFVDDLLILVTVQAIDGEGQVLANAAPCGLDSQGRVRVGIMNFDLADIERLIALNRAETVVLHEMGHVLGIGTLWESRGLIDTDGWIFQTYRYLGEEGNKGNEEIGMEGEAIIENEGGQGTAKSHWKEKVYTTELMTGFVSDNGTAPLSLLTVRSLADLGYTVNITEADPFTVDEDIADDYDLKEEEAPKRLRGEASAKSSSNRESYGDDIAKFPVIVLPEHPRNH